MTAFALNQADLAFVLKQIKIAEAHAAGAALTEIRLNAAGEVITDGSQYHPDTGASLGDPRFRAPFRTRMCPTACAPSTAATTTSSQAGILGAPPASRCRAYSIRTTSATASAVARMRPMATKFASEAAPAPRSSTTTITA